MSDLTERLRKRAERHRILHGTGSANAALCDEAATTLETLTQEVERLKAVSEDHFRNAQRLAGEVAKRDVQNARLREALSELVDE